MLKNNKGITLIALVVTIIVLLILAGVTIAMLTGTNGILTQASKAGSTTKVAEAKEIAGMDVSALVSEYYEERYVNGNTTITSVKSFVETKLPGTATGKSNYYTFVEADPDAEPDPIEAHIQITPKDEAGATITGDIQTDGSIKWD